MTTSKYKIKPSILIAVGIAAILGGWLYSGPGLQAKSPDGAPVNADQKIPKITEEHSNPNTAVRVVESIAYNHQPTLTITAQTKYNRMSVLRSETFGTVTQMNFDELNPVEKGETLAQLEIRDRGAQIERAKARVDQREIEYQAANKLAQKGFNSQIRKTEAIANLEIAKADLLTAQIEYQNTTIKSPFAGYVLTKHIEKGDFIQTGDDVAKIVDLDPIYVVAFVSEQEISNLQYGDIATATLTNGKQYEGVISHISPVAQEATRSFEVKVEIPNENYEIRSGLTAKIQLPKAPIKAHYLSPALLTLNDQGKVGVKTVENDNIVKFNPVQIIEDTNEGVWVSGLADQADIIAVGQEYVKHGNKVTISTYDPHSDTNG